MREIEFRGKRIDNGEWVYGNLMQFEDSATFIFVDERKGASTLTYAHFIINNMHAIDEKTVGQYTVLKDKNGKKIFEGDIVDISVYDRLDWSSIKGKVVFLNGAWLVVDVGHFAITLQSETNEIEIIGNVHENLGLWEA
ncbi:TPA: YopX family protein [Listeria monocytogenes]|uniref:YopX family protein n=1 Tax=Listeria TaxID=1637 RepID=UPI000BE052B8|nr:MULTISPECIES: YopX family protein [Listeria]EAA0224423.1 hypothetical protein [Listeria monocytogenes]EAC3733134.1 hypothetical protein [Listeria monocytogenes]EAC3748489.1 hypothetical protein [Listeria monocytogenes]EAC5166704.1 hypothetical protein [Listeria monocytogenes]EAC7372660.1 hypothetical protein [Listeria monocytogenes]